jgi:hypothetical protein
VLIHQAGEIVRDEGPEGGYILAYCDGQQMALGSSSHAVAPLVPGARLVRNDCAVFMLGYSVSATGTGFDHAFSVDGPLWNGRLQTTGMGPAGKLLNFVPRWGPKPSVILQGAQA